MALRFQTPLRFAPRSRSETRFVSPLPSDARQHAFQGVIAKNKVMHERCGHVERCQDHKKIG